MKIALFMVSWIYQLGNRTWKVLKNIIFLHQKLKDYGLNLFLGKTWSFHFASIFEKSVTCDESQNHEGACNLGKTFWNPKKLLISSIEKKYQLCALLESGIEGLKLWTLIDHESLSKPSLAWSLKLSLK